MPGNSKFFTYIEPNGVEQGSKQLMGEYSNNGIANSIIGINTLVELKPGEKVVIYKESSEYIVPNVISELQPDDTFGAPVKTKNIIKFDDFLPKHHELESHGSSGEQNKPILKQRWIMMLKKQLTFLSISIITIILSLIGAIFFLITKSTVIYPTTYFITLIMGIWWLITAIKGINDVFKRI